MKRRCFYRDDVPKRFLYHRQAQEQPGPDFVEMPANELRNVWLHVRTQIGPGFVVSKFPIDYAGQALSRGCDVDMIRQAGIDFVADFDDLEYAGLNKLINRFRAGYLKFTVGEVLVHPAEGSHFAILKIHVPPAGGNGQLLV